MTDEPIGHPLRVFVVGCARGGTTVTQKVLSERLMLFSLPETRFFWHMIGNGEHRMFPRTHRQTPWLRWQTSRIRRGLGLSTGHEFSQIDGMAVPEGRKWSSTRRVTREFVAILDAAATSAHCRGWLEKSPVHVLFADDISRLVADAWIVHVVRDPLDTIASIWSLARTHAQPWGAIYDRLERAVDHWNASTAASATMIGRPRQIFLSYELLSNRPQHAVSRIAALLGAPVTGGAIAERGRIVRREETWKARAVNEPVKPAHSQWDTALTAAEQRRVSELVQPIPPALAAALTRLEA